MLLVSAWMGLLFAGYAAGRAIHLLLVGAAVAFPWRVIHGRPQDPPGDESPG